METPPHRPSPRELRDILNYTIVALFGMIAGFMVGYIIGYGNRPGPDDSSSSTIQRP